MPTSTTRPIDNNSPGRGAGKPMPLAAGRKESTSAEREILLERALANTQYHRFPGGRKKIRVLVDLIADFSPGRPRVLDVGCGKGSLSFPMAALGCEVVGVDVDPDSIAICQEQSQFDGTRFLLTEGDLHEVDGQFDLIVCSEVLEHLPNPDPLIAAMHNRLAPQGRIFITIPNGYGLRELLGRCEELLRRRCGLDRPLSLLRSVLGRFGMVSPRDKHEMHTANPHQKHVQKFTRRDILARLHDERLNVLAWTNSFVVFSVFCCRSGVGWVERADCWAADHLPSLSASGWYIVCGHTR